MMKTKHIFDPVFTQNYWYIEADSYEKYKKICKKKWNVDFPIKQGTCGEMRVIEQDEQEIVLIWTRRNDLKSIVHECMHAVSYIMRIKGIELTDESEETYCYVIAFLFKEITSNKIDRRIEIRKDNYEYRKGMI